MATIKSSRWYFYVFSCFVLRHMIKFQLQTGKHFLDAMTFVKGVGSCLYTLCLLHKQDTAYWKNTMKTRESNKRSRSYL